VAHRDYKALSVPEIQEKLLPGGIFIDVKSAFDTRALSEAGLRVWRL